MGAAGDLAVETLKFASASPYILAVEGGVPTAFNGHTCMLWTDQGQEVTAMEAVQELAPGALAVLSVGTCSSFGGIPSGAPNPTGIQSISQLTGLETINIAGCPTHPDWIVWTIAQLLAGSYPTLMGDGRPSGLFGGEDREVHERCPREDSPRAQEFGCENMCLRDIGCKGPQTQADCPTRKWNNGTNWCIGANSNCIACTEAGFPDSFSPLYYPPAFVVSRPLSITRAEWEDGDGELRVEGYGTVLAAVEVRDAGSGALLGSTTVSREGRWRIEREHLSTSPSRVIAESGTEMAERDVSGGSSSMGMELTKAEWRAEAAELRVEGRTIPNRTVQVKNATTGVTLASTSSDSEGNWAFTAINPNPIPVRVRAECEGYAAERDVENAPQEVPAFVEITTAQYQLDTSKLIVDGNGSVGRTVVVKNASTGGTLASQTIGPEGSWAVQVSNPTPIPGRVRAECEDTSAERTVEQVGTPPAEVTISKAEYRSRKRELKVEGRGTPGSSVTVRDAVDSTIYGTAGIDRRGRWNFVKKHPSPVPSRVRAECGAAAAEQDVTSR
jgi:hydrogenase small subunit